MINAQPPIFTVASTQLKAKFPGIKVTGELSDTETVFPCVQIEESSNVPVFQDNSPTSFYAAVQYRVAIFSNKNAGKTTEARSILSALDEVFEPLNLRRTAYTAQSGLYANSVYRITATYEAVIDENGTMYRR